MEITCKFSVDKYRNEKFWNVNFQPKNLYTLEEQEKLCWMYSAKIDIHRGKVTYIDFIYSNYRQEIKESEETNLDNINEHKKLAEEIFNRQIKSK